MHIYLSTSKHFYSHVATIKSTLENLGHNVTPPNGYNDAQAEGLIQRLDDRAYQAWKADMLRKNSEFVAGHDAILALNLTREQRVNYIGGATFLEIFKAFELGKKIFLYNPVPEGVFKDELIGMSPVIIHGQLKHVG